MAVEQDGGFVFAGMHVVMHARLDAGGGEGGFLDVPAGAEPDARGRRDWPRARDAPAPGCRHAPLTMASRSMPACARARADVAHDRRQRAGPQPDRAGKARMLLRAGDGQHRQQQPADLFRQPGQPARPRSGCRSRAAGGAHAARTRPPAARRARAGRHRRRCGRGWASGSMAAILSGGRGCETRL